MRMRAGVALAGVCALMVFAGGAAAADADELSDKAVNTFMDYAWQLTPAQFSGPEGSTIVIDKKKRDEVMIPLAAAREVILAGRLSAHAQICDLGDDQIANHRALMRRQEILKKWTPQQIVYISQLHLTVVMLMTGRIKLVEQDGDKKVLIDETKEKKQTCTDEQRKKVKELITAYVAGSPTPKELAEIRQSTKGAAAAPPTSTGSVPAPDQAAAPAAPEAAPPQ